MAQALRRRLVIACGVDVDVFTPDGPQAPRREASRRWCRKVVAVHGFRHSNSALPITLMPSSSSSANPTMTTYSPTEACPHRELAEQLGVADRLRLHRAAIVAAMPACCVRRCRRVHPVVRIVRRRGTASDGLRHSRRGLRGGRVARHRRSRVTGNLVPATTRGNSRPQSTRCCGIPPAAQPRCTGRDRTLARYKWDRIATDTVRLYEKSISVAAASRHLLPFTPWRPCGSGERCCSSRMA